MGCNCTCVQSYEAPGDVQFTPNQLAYIWQAAGGNMQVVGIAVAIAMRESGGHSTATCVNGGPGCGPCMGAIDRGLWQIDSVHGAGSSYDVMTNARTAVALYNAQGWEPWGGPIAPYNVTPDPNTPINATQAAANIPTQPTLDSTQATDESFWGSLGHDVTHPWDIPGQIWSAGEHAIFDSVIKSVILMILNPLLTIAAGMFGIAAGGTMFLFGLFLLVSDASEGGAMGGMGKLGEIGGAGLAIGGLVTGQPEIMAAGGAMATGAGALGGVGAAARSKASDVRSQRVGERSEARAKRQGERTAARQQAAQQRMADRTTYQQEQLNRRQAATAGARSDLSGQRHAESMTRESFRTEQFGVREELRNRSREFNRQQRQQGRQGPPDKPKRPPRNRDPRGRFV